MAGVTGTKDALIKRLQQEREGRNYPISSRWYQFLNDAINFVQEAELSNSPKDRFYNAWSAIRRVAMMTRKRGQIENVTLSNWIQEIQSAPQVRRVCESTSLDFLKSLERAQNNLLYDGERNQWRESKQYVDSWQKKIERGQAVSPEKACTHTFLMGRDLRNAVSHADFNPNSNFIRKALAEAANVYFPLSIAVIESIIEHPPHGTTGKANPYRSFLYPFLINSNSFFSDYYLEKLMNDKELAHFSDEAIKDQLKAFSQNINQRDKQLSLANTVEATLEQWCQPVLFPALGIKAKTGTRIVTDAGIFEPTGVIALLEQAIQTEYQGKAARRDLTCLVWVLPWRSSSLDAIPAEQEQLSEEESPFAGLTYMEIAQRSLLGSDVPWGIITNGRKLRLLSKGTAHKPRAFIEMNLQEIINLRGSQDGKKAFRYLLGLFSGESITSLDDAGRTRLDRILRGSDRYGETITSELKKNVFSALEKMGDGFLEYMKTKSDEVSTFSEGYTINPSPSEKLLTDIYQESLGLMYRLLFLFYAESRDMLPMENELYRETYSLESLRDEIRLTIENPSPTEFFSKGSLELWGRLKQLFVLVERGGLGKQIPAYDGGLFDPDKHPFLEAFAIGDSYLAEAIDLLSRTRPSKDEPRGGGRKKVTYRDLDVRHLGTIYEGILEYAAHIATEELAIMQRVSGGKKYEEYVGISALKADELLQFAQYKAALEEDFENPPLPSRCKISGLKEPGQYFLVFGGRESKRKSSGSYYTPDYIVQYIVENTLGPLVRGENRKGELHNKLLTSEKILELKVLDPAMGSGHFLVAATEFLARAYGEALIREGKDDDGVMSEEEFIRYKRLVAERCIYGVDINSMAVELAKLSMWLFTMDSSRPLSFLNHHLKCGNALIGAWIEDLGELPKLDSKKRYKRKTLGQINIFEQHFRAKVPVMVQDLFQIMEQETNTIEDISLKKAWDDAIETLKAPFLNIADSWLKVFWSGEAGNYNNLLMSFDTKEPETYEGSIINNFHWELNFPEVFFDKKGDYLDLAGFDAVIGNPPYDVIEKDRGGTLRPHSALSRNNSFDPDYAHAIGGKLNIFRFFMVRAITLLKVSGRFGMIVPLSILGDISCSKTRKYILSQTTKIKADCFPQKDDSSRRVFESAKLSTVIISSEKAGGNTQDSVDIRTYPGKDFMDSCKMSSILIRDLDLMDPEHKPVPLVDSKDWELCKKIYNSPNVSRLGDITDFEICRGEINQTIYRKYIKGDQSLSRLVKGVEIGRFFVREKLSQGSREWFDEEAYISDGKFNYLASRRRIATQRITGVDEKERIIAGIINPPAYFADSTNSISKVEDGSYSLEYLLGLLNSSVCQWRFRLTSTNNNVGTNELKGLPFVRTRDCESERILALESQIDASVKSILEESSPTQNPSGSKLFLQKIKNFQDELDQLVYELFQLNKAEIDIIKRGAGGE